MKRTLLRLLAIIGLTHRSVWEDARARKARGLVQHYERREREAVRRIQRILAGAGKSMDALMADALRRST